MLNIEDSLIVIIDIQEKLNKSVKEFSPLKNAVKIAKASSILNVPVLVTEQYPKGLGYTLDELKKELTDAIYIEKNSFSACLNQDFQNMLKHIKRKQIIIFGIETHICVYQTICDLINLGYDVYFVKDASASRNKMEFDIGVDLINKSGAFVTSTEIVLFELIKTAQHPKFKEIQALIK